jgi:hypothetical protein
VFVGHASGGWQIGQFVTEGNAETRWMKKTLVIRFQILKIFIKFANGELQVEHGLASWNALA